MGALPAKQSRTIFPVTKGLRRKASKARDGLAGSRSVPREIGSETTRKVLPFEDLRQDCSRGWRTSTAVRYPKTA